MISCEILQFQIIPFSVIVFSFLIHTKIKYFEHFSGNVKDTDKLWSTLVQFTALHDPHALAMFSRSDDWLAVAWTSYQIRKIAGCAFLMGKPGTFSPPPNSKGTASLRSRYASRHVRHAHAVMHVGIANPRRRGKRSRHSRRMRKPRFYVSGKRHITEACHMGQHANAMLAIVNPWHTYPAGRHVL